MRSNGILTSLTGAMLFAATPASAVVIAEYTFDSNSQASADLSPETNATNADFGAWNGDWAGSTTSNMGFSSNLAFVRSPLSSTDLSNGSNTGAIGHNDYLGFTIQGSGFDITSISFSHAMTDTDNGNTYQAHLFTSATGFAAGNVLQSTTLAGTGSGVSGGLAFDATGTAALQGLASDLEVRIYITDSQDTPGFVHTIDNIVVNGTPEPGSLALLGLGGAFLLWHRRRV